MNEYYGVSPSSDFFAHYGVRGMRWGVRKAIEYGDQARLKKHYIKAQQKLAKLNARTNRDLQRKIYNQSKSNMLAGGLGSAALSAAGTAALNSGLSVRDRILTSAGAGLAGGLAGVALNSDGISAKRYMSRKGHAKAVAERNEFKREMDAAFKGTKYGRKRRR